MTPEDRAEVELMVKNVYETLKHRQDETYHKLHEEIRALEGKLGNITFEDSDG